jgi:hypothetical protein
VNSAISQLISTVTQNKGKILAILSVLGLSAASTVEVDGSSIGNLLAAALTESSGWLAFGMLSVVIVVGAFFEWWVPGRRHRRVEQAAAEQSKVLGDTVTLLSNQTMANEITRDFFLKTDPKRGETTS